MAVKVFGLHVVFLGRRFRDCQLPRVTIKIHGGGQQPAIQASWLPTTTTPHHTAPSSGHTCVHEDKGLALCRLS